jgi:tetratricopeptide (TPR) repeat protein
VKKSLLQKTFTHLILIVILCLIAYSNTFESSFHFDDLSVIVGNPIIKDIQYFTSPSKASIFTEYIGYDTLRSRYIGYLTFALNYSIHGLDTTGYHIINLLIHVCTSLLVYLLIHLTFQTPFLLNSKVRDYSQPIALFTALLFACHPVQTQAVTYIWQRVSSLSTMLYVLSCVTYIKWRLRQFNKPVSETIGFFNIKSIALYLISIISAIFAMKTKETAFMLPVMVTLYEFIFFQGKTRKRILYLIPLLLTILIIPLTLINIDKPLGDLIGDISDETKGVTTLSREAYLLTSFRVVVTYIRLLFLPINQNLDYDYPTYYSFFNIEVVISFLFLLLIFGTGIFLLYRYRHTASHVRLISFGIFWFFINLLLESSVIPLNNVIYEHRMYLPSIGGILAFSASLFILAEKLNARWKVIGSAVAGMMAIIVIILTGTTYARNSVWKDELTLWQDVVNNSPNKARGHNNLGDAYKNIGMIEKAKEQYQIAIKLSPGAFIAHNNLGNLYNAKGLMDKSIEHYHIAISINPNYKIAYNNLGNAYYSQGLYDEAIINYIKAIKIYPYYSKAHNGLGNVYKSQGFIDMAIREYRIALKFDSKDPNIYYNLGLAYTHKGLTDLAIQQYQIALALKPDYAKAHNNLGIVYMTNGFIDMAIEHIRTALSINPDYVDAHYNLGIAYDKSNRHREAIKEFKEALKLRPGYIAAHVNLGISYGKLNMYREAIKEFKEALKINPDHALIHYNLASAYKYQGLIDKAKEHMMIARKLNPALFDKRFGQQEFAEEDIK